MTKYIESNIGPKAWNKHKHSFDMTDFKSKLEAAIKEAILLNCLYVHKVSYNSKGHIVSFDNIWTNSWRQTYSGHTRE
jgi:hypothetical protein